MSDLPKVDLPGVNWLVHVLTKLTQAGGTDIALGRDQGSSRDGWLKCSDERDKSLLLDMAALFKHYERETHRLLGEGHAAEWKPVDAPPDHSPYSAFRYVSVLATSPALRYVVFGGVAFARYRYGGVWEVKINNSWVRHQPSHWRHIPPAPGPTADYAEVKSEVERLRRKAAGCRDVDGFGVRPGAGGGAESERRPTR